MPGRGQGHVFTPEEPGSRWCATCHHHDSTTSHAPPEKETRP